MYNPELHQKSVELINPWDIAPEGVAYTHNNRLYVVDGDDGVHTWSKIGMSWGGYGYSADTVRDFEWVSAADQSDAVDHLIAAYDSLRLAAALDHLSASDHYVIAAAVSAARKTLYAFGV